MSVDRSSYFLAKDFQVAFGLQERAVTQTLAPCSGRLVCDIHKQNISHCVKPAFSARDRTASAVACCQVLTR